MASSALSSVTIPLGGSANARIEAMIMAGAITVVTAEVKQ